MPAPAAPSAPTVPGGDGAKMPVRPASTNGHAHQPAPLFESSPTFQMACRQLETVAGHVDLDPGVLERMSKPKRAMVVRVPVRLDNGRVECFIGLRVQHSLTSRPSKGGL